MTDKRQDSLNAVRDLTEAYTNRSVWMALGWNDVQTRYNRSKLGVFWASLSILIFVSALGPVYSHLFEVDLRVYLFHLMLGIVLWNYVSAIIMESGREFVSGVNYIVSFQLSYFTLLLRVTWRNFIVLSYQMIVFVFLALCLGQSPNITWLIVPAALLIITLNALWMGLIVSVLSTRFRDLSELLNNIFRLVFFITPIMWMPAMKADLELVAELNPFFHLIEIFRGPLLGRGIDQNSWLIAIVLLIGGWLVAFSLFTKYRSRIAFWI